MANTIGLEKFKYSRLDQKETLKFSLKSLTFPETLQTLIADRFHYSFKSANGMLDKITSLKQNVMYRLRFELDGFHTSSTLFSMPANA